MYIFLILLEGKNKSVYFIGLTQEKIRVDNLLLASSPALAVL